MLNNASILFWNVNRHEDTFSFFSEVQCCCFNKDILNLAGHNFVTVVLIVTFNLERFFILWEWRCARSKGYDVGCILVVGLQVLRQLLFLYVADVEHGSLRAGLGCEGPQPKGLVSLDWHHLIYRLLIK